MSTTTLRSHIQQYRQRINLRTYAKNALVIAGAAILMVLPELIRNAMRQTSMFLGVFETAPRLETVLTTIVSIGGALGGIDGAVHTLFLYAVLGGTAWYLGIGSVVREHRDVLVELLAASAGIVLILGVYHVGSGLLHGSFSNVQRGSELTIFARAVGINQLYVWFFAGVGTVLARKRDVPIWPTVTIMSVVVGTLLVYIQAMEGLEYLHQEFTQNFLITPFDLLGGVLISLWFVFGAILFMEIGELVRSRMNSETGA